MDKKITRSFFITSALVFAGLTACSSNEPVPQPVTTPVPVATPVPTPFPTPVVTPAPINFPMPTRGQSKRQVENEFGAPLGKYGPTGDPSIYYWEYRNFTVYFEDSYVLHAVSNYRSQLVK